MRADLNLQMCISFLSKPLHKNKIRQCPILILEWFKTYVLLPGFHLQQMIPRSRRRLSFSVVWV